MKPISIGKNFSHALDFFEDRSHAEEIVSGLFERADFPLAAVFEDGYVVVSCLICEETLLKQPHSKEKAFFLSEGQFSEIRKHLQNCAQSREEE